MPVPLVLGAIGAGLSAGVSGFQAIQDGKRAREEERKMDALMENRPEYQRPGEVNQSLGLAIARYGDKRMPGAETARQESQLLAANTATAAAAGGDPFAAALGGQARADATNRSIAVDESNYSLQQEQALANQLGISAQYTDQEFQMNEFAPWADALTRATNDFRDYRQASRAGFSESLRSLSSLGVGLMMGGSEGVAGSGGDVANSVIEDVILKYKKNNTFGAGQSSPTDSSYKGWLASRRANGGG